MHWSRRDCTIAEETFPDERDLVGYAACPDYRATSTAASLVRACSTVPGSCQGWLGPAGMISRLRFLAFPAAILPVDIDAVCRIGRREVRRGPPPRGGPPKCWTWWGVGSWTDLQSRPG